MIASRLGYEAMDPAALDSMVDDVIASNPEEWQRYRAGDEKVAQFLLGQVMRASKGRANGKLVAAAFAARRERLTHRRAATCWATGQGGN